jgi:hypothetical protein
MVRYRPFETVLSLRQKHGMGGDVGLGAYLAL